MHAALMFKIAFWLVVIGIAALVTPNPAWPEWTARFVLSLGVALAVTGFALPYIKRGRNKRKPGDE